MAPAKRDTLGGILLIAAVGVVWGTIPLVLRQSDGATLIKVFYRVVTAAMVLGVYMAASGRLSELTSLPRRKLWQLAGQGAILTLNWVLFLSALDLTNVATAELLGYTGPVFVAALAPFVSKERFDARIVPPLLLALGGIVVILAPAGLKVSTPREILGAVLAFSSAITYAILLLRSKKILRGVSSVALMIVEYSVASLLLAPVAVWLYAQGQGPTGAVSYGALVTLGVVHTAGTGIFFLSGLRRVRADHAAIIMYAEPVSAVLFAAALLGEPLTWFTVVGGLAVVCGGVLVARMEPSFGPESASVTENENAGDGSDAPLT